MTSTEGRILIEQHLLGPMANFGYLVGDESAGLAAVIDPSFDGRPLQEAALRHGLRIAWVLVTHGHPDHCGDDQRIAKETGAKVAAHRLSRARKDVALEDGQIIPVGGVEIRVMHTPGHSPDSCCFLAGSGVFTGDTLFVGDCGRTDLPGSDVDAMHDSLLRRIRGLPDELIVYPGHDYGESRTSTIGFEKANSRVLVPRTIEEFRRFMGEP